MPYFSERELAQKPRTRETLTPNAWKGIVLTINTRIVDGSFGHRFPRECSGCGGVYATDPELMEQAVRRKLPFLSWPLDVDIKPSLYDALDLVQFAYQNTSLTEGAGECINYNRRHLTFDDGKGKREFRDVINRIFARESLTFNLDEHGEVLRLAPLVLHEALTSAVFSTGEEALDTLLEDARHKFLNPDQRVRRESLEKLWDAWERLKTIEPPHVKPDSAKRLLDRVSDEPNFRQVLETEAKEITGIGNNFMIRHTEISKTPVTEAEHVDYLFHRLFSIIRLLLRSTNRGA